MLAIAPWPVDSLLPADAPADFFPDLTNAPSPYGVFHLADNAAEWVQDFYDKSAYWSGTYQDPALTSSGRFTWCGAVIICQCPKTSLFTSAGRPKAIPRSTGSPGTAKP